MNNLCDMVTHYSLAFWDALDGSYCTLTAFNMTGNCNTPQCRDPEYPNPNAGPDQGAYHGPLMCGAHRPTNVISISYSGTEHSWPANYMRRQCFEVMKLGLQGITVVESSGDFGVGGRRFDTHGGCLGRNRTVFSPRVLGNCPYVLSVGATTLLEPEYYTPGTTPKLTEVAAERFASGGGFSNVFERPAYQDKHVREYFERANITHLGYNATGGQGYAAIQPPPEPGKLFNLAGRGYPDVSALGESFRVVLRGWPNRVHGTSVATPIWASILTLINEERLARGKSTVGFVHPVLVSGINSISPERQREGENEGLTVGT
jgi:tripeptidyl-peptidase-1